MALNGSEFLNNTWNISWSPWTDLFSRMTGNGQVFWLVPIIVLTMGVYVKTESTVMTSMFMMGAGAILGMGTLAMQVPQIPIMFGLFAALGLITLFTQIIFK